MRRSCRHPAVARDWDIAHEDEEIHGSIKPLCSFPLKERSQTPILSTSFCTCSDDELERAVFGDRWTYRMDIS